MAADAAKAAGPVRRGGDEATRGLPSNAPFSLAIPAPRAIDLRRLWKIAQKDPDPMIVAGLREEGPGAAVAWRDRAAGARPQAGEGLGDGLQGRAVRRPGRHRGHPTVDRAARHRQSRGRGERRHRPRRIARGAEGPAGRDQHHARRDPDRGQGRRQHRRERQAVDQLHRSPSRRSSPAPATASAAPSGASTPRTSRSPGTRPCSRRCSCPKATKQLRVGITGWVREAGLFGRPKEWLFDTASFTIDVER